jgi:hypothetical protein
MTAKQMQTSLRTGFNPQGRHVSSSMAVKYMAALGTFQPKQLARYDYRGFEISGKSGHWYVKGETSWQTIYTSEAKARAAVDACLTLRSILAAA